MSKDYLEAWNFIKGQMPYFTFSHLVTEMVKNADIVEQALQRLEVIDNSNPSEALVYMKFLFECWERLVKKDDLEIKEIELEKYIFKEYYDTLKQALIKLQEQEKENELLKKIIKNLFDKGRPLNQFKDDKDMLQIEVNDDGLSMSLGKYKGVDLDKKLKEVLENE